MLKCVNKFVFRDKTLPISKKQGQTSKNLPSTVVDSKPKKKTILDDMSDDEEVDGLISQPVPKLAAETKKIESKGTLCTH